jgi:hypothetical protein
MLWSSVMVNLHVKTHIVGHMFHRLLKLIRKKMKEFVATNLCPAKCDHIWNNHVTFQPTLWCWWDLIAWGILSDHTYELWILVSQVLVPIKPLP